MATKTANVLARVDPEVKAQAETILDTLGIPTSVLINMLYKQIILTKSIPFSLKIPVQQIIKEEMSDEEFKNMIENGISQANMRSGKPAQDVFDAMKNGV